ncbi:MarR family transcriptional regulator [Alkalicella caledoniensis]|uniref:HTH-type transcriptional regulator SarZ n=1 Tax=Alkalicella caledoniensis TaxID=2731377 RepID=A0A7G9W9U7_ALKCA|nr:MarR family transcriptional regulator [Alkalicella caledoniensis]QNO15459.1 MarR family transcriptional regulator [Alkalicella caledoniensis]
MTYKENTLETNYNHEDDILKLDNQLCFSLYVCSKEIIKKYKPLLEPFGLTYTGYITLLALWEKDNITVKELGKKLYLDSGTLTPLLKKLESLDYVNRVRSSVDERNVHVVLTEKGQRLKAEAVEIPKKLICSSNLSEESALDIYLALKKLMSLVDG